MKSINPATGEVIREFKNLNYEDCIRKLKQTKRTFLNWSKLPFSKRAKCLKHVAYLLKKNKQEYAKRITLEIGKPITESIKEIEKCAWVCEYFANNSEEMLKDEFVKTEAKKSYVTFEPLGIIMGIMPWNFPFWQVFRFAVPALMAGNVCIVKHASNVPWCSSSIENIFNKAGMKNVYKNLLINSEIATKLIEREEISGVSITGSVKVGKKIAEAAGKNLKRCVLELGGSDAYIILNDADLKNCCITAAKARLINSGQSCIAAKRFIVVKSAAKKFEKAFIEQVKSMKLGNPMNKNTQIGPLAKHALVENLDHQVNDAIKNGAKVLYGGHKLKNNFYMPTVLTNVKNNMLILNEETFGPVAPIIIVKDENEAIQTANNTKFGLGTSIWTKNLKKAEKLAKQIQAGVISINDMVKSDPRLPFGGIKNSGFGRELSHYGIKEFVNIKSIIIEG